jgi:tRNA(Arg) A34 adenosine deaminase TadA
MNDEHWMQQALVLTQKAEAVCEVPVGAVIV